MKIKAWAIVNKDGTGIAKHTLHQHYGIYPTKGDAQTAVITGRKIVEVEVTILK